MRRAVEHPFAAEHPGIGNAFRKQFSEKRKLIEIHLLELVLVPVCRCLTCKAADSQPSLSQPVHQLRHNPVIQLVVGQGIQRVYDQHSDPRTLFDTVPLQ